MFIKKIQIKNFRLFDSGSFFELEDLNFPNGTDLGSGINIFVGENACGKTSLLDAIALPILAYKADNFSINDLHKIDEKCEIRILANSEFTYNATVPRKTYRGKGLEFKAGLRNRSNSSYLSSLIVSDQTFIRADGETEPEDNKPDIRLNVNNPWSGNRYDQTDVLYLDRNRTYQTRGGTYNPTRFDRLMEDFDYQYIKDENTPLDFSDLHTEIEEKVENAFLDSAIGKFNEICGITLKLGLVDSIRPHKYAFFAEETAEGQNVLLESLGSGYEMVFSLIYSYYLATQRGKDLIILIDEPELHLHPKIQREFIKLLLEVSKTTQIVMTTHSPLFVKHLLENENTKTFILKKSTDGITVDPITERKLPYLSANEINFVAFNLATEEYHNELYEGLKDLHGSNKNYKQFDNDYLVSSKGEVQNSPYFGNSNEVSIHTFIRNKIHHRADNGVATYDELLSSIEKLRSFY